MRSQIIRKDQNFFSSFLLVFFSMIDILLQLSLKIAHPLISSEKFRDKALLTPLVIPRISEVHAESKSMPESLLVLSTFCRKLTCCCMAASRGS